MRKQTPRKIEHTQLERGCYETECVDCLHESVCRRFDALQSLPITRPYTVTFTCEQFVKA